MPLSRSQQMSRIHGKNTGPERVLRSAIWAAGLRYRIHHPTPAGRPDVVFPTTRVAVFVDGCFWHGCPQHYVRPRSREAFWSAKLRGNVERDRRQTLELETMGWHVLRVWEHEVYENLDQVVEIVRGACGKQALKPPPTWRVVFVEAIDDSLKLERRHLELLRNPQTTRRVEGQRITAKWRRPR